MPTVTTNGVETYYERRGDGPPVVFVPGAILDHTAWAAQVEALSDEYTTIAYDVRGHGRTGGSDVESYTIDLLADDLAALVAALDLDRPVVCGLSMGGCIAQAYAAADPDALSGLVLADTFAPPILDRREWIQRSLLLRAAIPPVRVVGYERVERVLVWLYRLLYGSEVSGDYDRITALRAERPPMDTDEFAKVVRALATFHESSVDLPSITVPTLALYGEYEPPFFRRHAARIGDLVPDAIVREVPGAGHASNLDEPEAFTEAVRAFLGEIHSSN